MDLDEYQTQLSLMTSRCISDRQSPLLALEALAASDRTLTQGLIDARGGVTTSLEEAQASAYLTIGYFMGHTGRDRLLLFVIGLELELLTTLRELRERFARYDARQPLFVGEPSLLLKARKEELLPVGVVTQVDGSEIARCPKGFGRLEPLLPPSILAWTLQEFSERPVFVRLTPLEWFPVTPPSHLAEVILVPADPSWWRTLSLWRGTSAGGVYLFQPIPPTPGRAQEYWDYHVRGVRRLDTSADRRGDNLSMMLEELVDIGARVVGRCIHLDVTIGPGVDFASANVNHLDLAVNVYEGSARDERMAAFLRDGMVANATFRTHLLRVEGIPLRSLFAYARLFFLSPTLTMEWITDQCGGAAEK